MNFFVEVLSAIFGSSGFAALPTDWRQVVMIVIACVLLYMGIGKGYAHICWIISKDSFRKVRSRLLMHGSLHIHMGTIWEL